MRRHCFVFGSRTFGGHEIMAAQIAHQLILQGDHVRIVCSRDMEVHLAKLFNGFEYINLKHKERRFEFFLGYLNPRLLSALAESLSYVAGFDTVILVNGGIGANHTLTLACAIAAKFKGVRAAIYFPMLHDPSELGVPWYRRYSYIRAQLRSAHAYQYFFTIDKLWCDRLLQIRGPDCSAFIIHNYINVSKSNNISSLIDHDRNIFRICYVGRMDKQQKGLDLLLESIKYLNEFDLSRRIEWWILGSGPFESTFKEECSKLEVGNQSFKFFGWVSEPYKLMRDCDLLVLPSRFEGISTVVVEALSSGVDVIAFNILGMDKLLKHNSMIAPFDTYGLAAALVKRCEMRHSDKLEIGPNEYIRMLCDAERFTSEVQLQFSEFCGLSSP